MSKLTTARVARLLALSLAFAARMQPIGTYARSRRNVGIEATERQISFSGGSISPTGFQ